MTNSPPKIRIGTAGWSYPDWGGIFYPPEVQRRKVHPLEYCAQFFDVVEVGTSFYDHIKPELAKLWARRAMAVNPDFVFTAKLHRSFTHSPLPVMGPTSAATIKPTDEDEMKARRGLEALASEGKLGALLIQFPLSFKNSSLNREYIELLSRQFIEYPRVIEVRNDTWDNAETIAYFARQNIAFSNVDPPQLGYPFDVVEQISTSLGYVRLHGRNPHQWFDLDSQDDPYNHLYSETEIESWKRKIERIAGQAQTTYVVANNHVEARAATNAIELKRLLTGKRGIAPPQLIRHCPELRRYADPAEDLSGPKLPMPA